MDKCARCYFPSQFSILMNFPTSFTFSHNNCRLKDSAELVPLINSTAGWCPKGIKSKSKQIFGQFLSLTQNRHKKTTVQGQRVFRSTFNTDVHRPGIALPLPLFSTWAGGWEQSGTMRLSLESRNIGAVSKMTKAILFATGTYLHP